MRTLYSCVCAASTRADVTAFPSSFFFCVWSTCFCMSRVAMKGKTQTFNPTRRTSNHNTRQAPAKQGSWGGGLKRTMFRHASNKELYCLLLTVDPTFSAAALRNENVKTQAEAGRFLSDRIQSCFETTATHEALRQMKSDDTVSTKIGAMYTQMIDSQHVRVLIKGRLCLAVQRCFSHSCTHTHSPPHSRAFVARLVRFLFISFQSQFFFLFSGTGTT